MNKIFLYYFSNAISFIPGLIFIFGGKYFLEDFEFTNFVKEKTIIVFFTAILSMGLSQAVNYLRSYQTNLKLIIFHIQIFHIISAFLLIALLIFCKIYSEWFGFLSILDCVNISLIIFLILCNSEMLNTLRITSFHIKFFELILLRVAISIIIYFIYFDYLISLLISETIIFVFFYRNNFNNNIKKLSYKTFLKIVNKGLPFVLIISMMPSLLFLTKYSLGFIEKKPNILINDFEIIFTICNIFFFLSIGPLKTFLFPLMVRSEKTKKARPNFNENFLLFNILCTYLVIKIFFFFSIHLFEFIEMDIDLLASSLDVNLIQLFTAIGVSHIFWISRLYEKGEIKKMTLPFIISIIVSVIVSYIGVYLNSTTIIITSCVLGVWIFFFLGIFFENKNGIYKRIVLMVIMSLLVLY